MSIDEQSPNIAQGVDASEEVRGGTSGEDQLNLQGAGDQGMMFGYACDETADLMPLPIWTAHRLAERLAEVRKSGQVPYLRPDGKTQVTYEYEDGRPVALKTVLISTQHQDGVDRDTVIRPDLIEQVIRPTIPEQFADDDYEVWINPTGTFVLGGPHADCGLTGRKIIVDTYGGMGRHGGGAFSGKDPSKVDRSGAYAARWVAKHVVASGAATRCEVQVAYAIGVAHPMSILVETFGTNTVPEDVIEKAVRSVFDLRPAAILRDLDLRRPIYRDTAAYGHFGRAAARLLVGAHHQARRLQVRRRRLSRRLVGPGVDQRPLGERSAHDRRRVVRVSPDVTGLDKEFDYVVPDGLDAPVGTRVRVPLHGRRVAGWVVAADPPDAAVAGAPARASSPVVVAGPGAASSSSWPAGRRCAGRRRASGRSSSRRARRRTSPALPPSRRTGARAGAGPRRRGRAAGRRRRDAAAAARRRRRAGAAGGRRARPDARRRAVGRPGPPRGQPAAPGRARRGAGAAGVGAGGGRRRRRHRRPGRGVGAVPGPRRRSSSSTSTTSRCRRSAARRGTPATSPSSGPGGPACPVLLVSPCPTRQRAGRGRRPAGAPGDRRRAGRVAARRGRRPRRATSRGRRRSSRRR